MAALGAKIERLVKRHYSREKVSVGCFMCRVRLAVVILFCTAVFGCSKSEIDSCLDQGGSYNYVACKCDLQGNHEFKENHACGL